MIPLLLWCNLAAAEPVAARGLLYARPFTLESPYPWAWSAEGGAITEGILAAFMVDPELGRPRDAGQRVLYAGASPVERMNPGWPSGCVFVILPGRPDLSQTPVYFGGETLPEKVDKAAGEAELQAALDAGIAPTPAVSVELLSQPEIRVQEIREIYRLAAELIPDCAPEDQSWAETWGIAPPP